MKPNHYTTSVSLIVLLGPISLVLGANTTTHACPDITPHNCTCKESMHLISCLEVGLTTIPDDLPNFTEMRFERNNITVLQHFPYSSLKILFLTNNSIRFIYDGAFSELIHLETLNLAFNELSSLRKETFTGLSSLRSLKLEGNPLYELTDYTLNAGTLPQLHELTLKNCRLYKVGQLAMVGLSNLLTVNVSHNNLSEPPRFAGASSLVALDMSYNRIKGWSDQQFRDLISLTDLSLSSNELNIISQDLFMGLSNLTSLHLRHNMISYVQSGAFSELRRLSDLDLSWNQLKTLDRSVYQKETPDPFKIRLHDNPWTCNCSTAWMVGDAHVRHWNSPETMKCAEPASVAGKPMQHADVHVFDCHDPHHHGLHSNTVALAVGLLFAILATILGSVVLYKLVIKKRMKRQKASASNPPVVSSYRRVLDTKELLDNMDNFSIG